ncbi:hypothetical protein GGS24DRAFT_500118 [Hypoxylon argillaceum]|nr:hypothetical protein GGS24DRAFT_500118 [Hypoxylon argillaceum]
MSSTMTMTQTMTPLERTRSRSNSGSKGRRTRVHFEIEDATPEFYGSKWIDFLSLYSGSSSFEVAIAALCSLGLFVAVGQGILEGPQLGIVAVLILASILHWGLMFLFSGPQSRKNDTLAEQDFNNRAHFQGAISWVVSISAPLSPYILQLRFSMKTSISFLSAAGPQTVDGLVAALASIMITMKRVDYDASLLANSFFVGGRDMRR